MLIVPNDGDLPAVPGGGDPARALATLTCPLGESIMETQLPTFITDAAHRSAGSLRWAIRVAGGSPLWHDGSLIFCFVGEAESVELEHWLDIFPNVAPFAQLANTPLWWTSVEVPPAARFDYRLWVLKMGKLRTILDPLNKRESTNPIGTKSEASGPEYVVPEWTLPNPETETGTVSEIVVESTLYGEERHVWCYVPAHPSPTMPLAVAHDGSDYVGYASLMTVLDNLIAAGTIPPLAVVLSDADVRTTEYAADLHHANFLVDELLPGVEKALGIDPRLRVAMGASLGGVASLHAAWRHPGVFDGLILQSGSFVRAMGGPHHRGPVFGPVIRWMDEFVEGPGNLPANIHMSCGQFDGLVDDNRALAAFLQERGVPVRYTDQPDGHDWTYWRNDLGPGLTHALGQA